jgi:asparagine synthase (glutamine-hydrolysing)
MLGGDGGDTLWGEYYPVAEFHRYIQHAPKFLRELLYQGAKGLRKITDWERFWELEHVSELFRKDNYYDDFLRRLCTYRHFSDEFQDSLLNKDVFGGVKPARSSLELEFNKDNFEEMLIEAKLFNAFYTYMSFFTYNSMESNGLNLYFPTINKDLIDFITSLPKEWVNGGTTFHRLTNHKSINRKFHKHALARYLKTEEIYNRSFDMPWYMILKPRVDVLEKLLMRLKDRGWYNNLELEKLFSEFRTQNVKDYELLELKHHGYRVYTLLALEIWCMEFIDGGIEKSYDSNISLEEYLSR